MANSRSQNVIRLDTTGTVPGPAGRIKSVLYIGDTNGTAALRPAVGAQILWERSGDVEVLDDIYLQAPAATETMHITITNGAVVYLYTA